MDGVLWAHRTTPKTATQEIPFALVYGTEVVIPAEMVVETQRVKQYQPMENEIARIYDLDILENKRTKARANIHHYQAVISRAYNKNVAAKDI